MPISGRESELQNCLDLAFQLLRQDPGGCGSSVLFSIDSIGMKGKHIRPVIVAGHIHVELAPRNVV